MKIQPLIGMMRVPQLFLAPNGAGGGGGAASGNSGTGEGEGEGDDAIDLGIDEELLDEESRTRLQAAKVKLQALQKNLKEAGTTKELLARVQQELDQLKQGQQRQQQQNQPKESTFEDEMVEHYMSKGLSKEEAIKAAELNAPILGKLAERMLGHMGQTIAPVANQVVQQQLEGTFGTLQESDWRMQVPEIAEAVWTKAGAMAEKGGQVSLPVMQNLLKIAYVDFMDANPDYEFANGTPPAPTRTVPPQRQPVKQGTRFTFPGAGHMPQGPRQTQQTSADPAIEAAMGHVKQHWQSWKPKGIPQAPKVAAR